MNYKNFITASFLFNLLFFSFLANENSAQDKMVGEITIENNTSAIGEQFVTVNNERILSGRSVFSPAEIETASQTAAKISIAKTGFIRFAPGTRVNLYFETASISTDLILGNITIDALPFTKFSVTTPDGAIAASNLTNENVFVVNTVDNKTQVKVLSGEVLFKGALVVAGQTFPADNAKTIVQKDDTKNSGGGSLILIVLGAAAAAAVVAVVALSGGNDKSSVSPVR